jgi:PAS domain S-box-containing protein
MGAYTVTSIIAESPRTVLYRALAEPTQRPVVIKAAARRPCPPRDLERLRNEYAITSRLELPGVVRALAMDTVDGMPALIFEDTGAEALNRSHAFPLPLDDFLALAVRIVEAVASLHECGILHKDLKPENILWDPARREIKLADLEIASQLPREQASSSIRLIEGSLPYIAPEQTGWTNRAVDTRSDLYSLGVTFYRLLTGRLPFHAHDPPGWVHCHIARVPAEPIALRPDLPLPVSQLVMKLLSKLPEDRYQTARGLLADLLHCHREWQACAAIAPLPLGTRDLSDRFQVPQRLYGRTRELRQLHEAFAQVRDGDQPTLLLVSGYSGSGKSALVRELREPVVHARGSFLEGKCDQYKRDIPHGAISEAVRELVSDLLSASEASLATWRTRLHEALGVNGQLVADVVPELELLIGKSPPVPELPPAEAQHRFHRVFRAFLGVFARPEHPLVLFVDDLQWADVATLTLLYHLVCDVDPAHLLVIGAYRNNEVDATHPLARMLDEIRANGCAVRQIVVGPLSRDSVADLIAETVRSERSLTAPLADLVHEKTGGNPFFALQFLGSLHEEGLLRYEHAMAAWTWDLPGIRAKGLTDNVIDLMIARLRRFPPATQEALRVAACLGNLVDLRLLAAIRQTARETLQGELWAPIRDGMLLAQGDSVRFAHDRVQQAAYSLLSAPERRPTHLRVARQLLETAADRLEEQVFDVVNQFNLAAELLAEPAERTGVAGLNLLAARKARAATAYRAGVMYSRAGRDLLRADCWQTQYDLACALLLEQAQCEYLAGEFERADETLTTLLAQARSFADRAAACRVRVELYTTQGRFADACSAAIAGLAGFGVHLELHPSPGRVAGLCDQVWLGLPDGPIEVLLELPWMTDLDATRAMQIFSALYVPAYLTDQNLLDAMTCEMMRLTLRYGNMGASCLAYAAFGAMVSSRFARYVEGDRFGRVALALVERHDLIGHRPQICNLYGHLNSFWTRPYEFAMQCAHDGVRTGAEIGDLTYACLCGMQLVTFALIGGTHLQEVEHLIEQQLAFIRKVKFDFVLRFHHGMRGMVESLRGTTRTLSSFTTDQFDETEFEARIRVEPDPSANFWYFVHKLATRFIAGYHREALAAAAEADQLAWVAGRCAVLPEYHFYAALTLAAVCGGLDRSQRADAMSRLAHHLERLARWEEHCPDNFAAKVALVRAEVARLRGERLLAEDTYEQAVHLARERGYVHLEAIGRELAARHYRDQGRDCFALACLREAHASYHRWGATAKVRQLEQVHPELRTAQPAAISVSFAAHTAQLDLLGVLKASQSISQEMLLPRLCEKLMRAILEHGGATRATLRLLPGRGERITADARVDGDEVTVRIGPGGDGDELPATLVGYVERARQTLLVEDALRSPRFAGDPYFAQHRVESALCMPIARNTALSGILYLENDALAGAFTPTRQLVLELLAAQAAISLENASLYSSLYEQQQHLQAVIDNTTAVIYAKDTSGRYLFVNRQFEEQFATRGSELRGKTDYDLFAPEHADRFRANDQAVLAGGGPLQAEEVVPHGDGLHTYITTKFPLRDLSGNVYAVCGISTDITGYKRMEEQLRQSQKLESIGRLAGGVAHDFNNILTAIVGNATLAAIAVHQPERVRSHLREIDHAAARGAALTKQLLVFARRQMISPRMVDLDQLVTTFGSMLQRLLGEDLALSIVPAGPAWPVRVDPLQIELLLMNLAANARDAMPGGGHLTIAIENLCLAPGHGKPGVAPGDYVVLRVSDTGVGMSEEVRSHLFEPFFTTKPAGQGTGLGLASCYGIVQQSGGHILCDSAPGHGTTFRILLPRLDDAEAVQETPGAGAARPAMHGGSETVLVVEDDLRVREVAVAALRHHGYRVLEAGNGHAALQTIATTTEAVAVLVTDMVMPEMGGRVLAERLRTTHPDLPVVFVSGYEPDIASALGPMTCFLPKPFRPDELVRRVREMCDARATAGAPHSARTPGPEHR